MTREARSARSRLLGRRVERRRDVEVAEVGVELAGIEASAGGQPVLGGELEEAAARPVGQDAEDVAQVDLGIETVQAGGGDESEEVARGLTVVVAADEEPRLSAGGDPAELALGFVM